MARIAGSSLVEGVLIDWSLDQPVAPAVLPVGLLSKEQAAAELVRLQRRKAVDAAYEAELVLRMAELTPDVSDPRPGEPGAGSAGWGADGGVAGVSEFFAGELALVLNRGRGTADHLFSRARVWRDRLPATFAGLAAGELDVARAAALAEVLGGTTTELARAVEAALLPEAVDLSVGRLRARALELLLTLDATAAEERRKRARKTADVFLQPGADGMATLGADLPADEAAEAWAVIDALAKMAKADGDDRPIAALRTELFSLLLRRPGGAGQPPVTAHLTITATLDSLTGAGTAAGVVDGLVITAAHVRELLARIGALGLQNPPAGGLTFALTDADGRLLATTTVAELLRLAKRGCAQHPEAGHPGQDCGCPVLGPPPATGAYTPTGRQQRFTKTRDRTCRMPGCAQRVGWTDLDHVRPHGCDGETVCSNLCCLCRSHHRLKTFAPGWHFSMDPDGTLHVTTPSGITRTTRPPGLRPPAPPPAEPPPPARHLPGIGELLQRPGPEPPGTGPDDDPPPF
ncbi:HNH endonuclease signature motif containing protein [Blastococcus sp. TF02A-30]|uniref:HNH endonuclease signature motif containing protein n=1 Tax=Blastococcus sp. TF02A-30 TaxID=2250580 RepID=UPI000DE98258|nr:HNH endonuclease signature motif containing protein [Blastococcus sp. TF02A-30]RBY87781.1 HNH endonuclease [Blastococcus sp. TF02A-30]